MVSMDIFHSDAFSAIQLTAAVEKIPYRPALLGSLNLFEPDRIRVEWAVIEKRDGTLALIQTSERGAPLAEQAAIKRDIRSFRTVRLAKGDTIRASELQNIRAFGSETDLQTVQQEVAVRLARLRNDLELTLENHRLGAIQGIVLDADGNDAEELVHRVGDHPGGRDRLRARHRQHRRARQVWPGEAADDGRSQGRLAAGDADLRLGQRRLLRRAGQPRQRPDRPT